MKGKENNISRIRPATIITELNKIVIIANILTSEIRLLLSGSIGHNIEPCFRTSDFD